VGKGGLLQHTIVNMSRKHWQFDSVRDPFRHLWQVEAAARKLDLIGLQWIPSSLSDLEIKGVHTAIIAKIFFKKIKYRAANAFDGLSPTGC
jgi:hypothetical protein